MLYKAALQDKVLAFPKSSLSSKKSAKILSMRVFI